MRAELKFIAEDYEDTQDLRKAANYSNAYLALFRITELIRTKANKTENEIYDELLVEVHNIMDGLSINIDNDVQ
jgi:hypothetical protein